MFSAIALVSFAISSNAQETGNAVAKATIETPITIEWVKDLLYGNLAVQSGTAGTVTLNPETGIRTEADGVTLPSVTGTFNAAEFNIEGTIDYTYSIILPADGDVLLEGPGADMACDGFTAYTENDDAIGLTGTLDNQGKDVLKVGATLYVAAGQVEGDYVSTDFDVIVNYN